MIDKRAIITISVILILIIGVCFLIKALFSGKGNSNDELYKLKIEMKDSAIEHYKHDVVMAERLIEEKDKGLIALHERDSILNVHYFESEILYKKINETIRNNSSRISRIATNNDSLRIILSREF